MTTKIVIIQLVEVTFWILMD